MLYKIMRNAYGGLQLAYAAISFRAFAANHPCTPSRSFAELYVTESARSGGRIKGARADGQSSNWAAQAFCKISCILKECWCPNGDQLE